MSLWTLVNVGTVAEVASGNLTLTEPAGVLAGDLLVACISYRSNAAFTLPASWANANEQNTGDTTAAATTSIGSGRMDYIVRGGAAPALVWNRTGGDVARGCIVAFRPSAGKATFDQASGNTLSSGSTTVTTPTMTTVEDGELLVMACCAARATTASAERALTDPVQADWTEHTDTTTTTGADCGIAVASAVKATAGATGTLQYTASASARHVNIVGAFRAKYNALASSGSYTHTGQAIHEHGAYSVFAGRTTVSSVFSSTVTFTSQPLGPLPESGGRVVVVAISLTVAAGVVINSATIAGVSATIVRQQTSAGNRMSAIIAASVPTGTTGNVVLTLSGQGFNGGALSWAVYHTTPGASATAAAIETSTDGTLGTTLDIPRFGSAIGMTAGPNYISGLGTVWTGLNEDSDVLLASDANAIFSGASLWTGVALTGQSISVDDVSTGNLTITEKHLIAASFALFDGHYTLAAAQGSYTLTGKAVILKEAHKLPVTNGVYSLTGQSIGLRDNRNLPVIRGLYTMTGQAVGLLKSIVFAIDPGSYALTGQDILIDVRRQFEWREEDGISDTWTEEAPSAELWNLPIAVVNTWTEESVSASSWNTVTPPVNTWTEEDL